MSRRVRTGSFIRRVIVVGLLVGVVLGVPTGVRRSVADDLPPLACELPFSATVRQGPSAGQAWHGTLTFAPEPGGAITAGTFGLEDGTRIPVTGQAVGQAISLLFDVGDGAYLYGTGVMADDLTRCGGITLGGSFVGPLESDAGDWLVPPPAPGPQQPSAVCTKDNVHVDKGLFGIILMNSFATSNPHLVPTFGATGAISGCTVATAAALSVRVTKTDGSNAVMYTAQPRDYAYAPTGDPTDVNFTIALVLPEQQYLGVRCVVGRLYYGSVLLYSSTSCLPAPVP